jgi:hypothetical protein
MLTTLATSATTSRLLRRLRPVGIALLLALVPGCHDHGPPPAVVAGDLAMFGGESPPVFIDDTFEFMYPIFLRHKIAQGPKAALWADRYYRRWIRWTGRIRSFTVNGITLRQLPTTSTFDVSLWINNDERAAVRSRYRVGDVVTYVGRLDSYDDIWRTLYLVNGSVIGVADAHDAGF